MYKKILEVEPSQMYKIMLTHTSDHISKFDILLIFSKYMFNLSTETTIWDRQVMVIVDRWSFTEINVLKWDLKAVPTNIFCSRQVFFPAGSTVFQREANCKYNI